MSRTPSDSDARWCPTCGSLVPPDRDSCPHCGMPMPRESVEDAIPDPLEPSEEELFERRQTDFLPRMASAIPDPGGSGDEGPRRDRTTLGIIVAAICAVIVLGIGFLLFAHPWDPDLYDISAQEPADTSMDGFPGTIERLHGQDTDESEATHLTSAEATYRDLSAAVDSLDEFDETLDEEFRTLESDFAASAEVRQQDAAEARSTAIAISNLIAQVQDLDMSSGVYLESQRTVIQLANYLRNRVDALTGAWEVSLASDDPALEKIRTVGEAEEENERYADLFRDTRRGLQLPEPNG